MNFEQLQYIYDTYSQHSFTKAAEINHVTVPTISMAVKKFESLFNCTLFDRSSSKLKISAEGEVIIQHIENILKEVSHLSNSLETISKNKKETLTIATIPGITQILFEETLKKNKPEQTLQWRVLEGSSETVVSKVSDHEAQLGLVVSREPIGLYAHLNWKPIAEDTIVFLTSTPMSEPESLKELEALLKSMPLALYDDPIIESFLMTLFNNDFSSNTILKSNNMETLIQTVLYGNALTIATTSIIKGLSTDQLNKLSILPLNKRFFSSPFVWQVTQKSGSISPDLNLFIDELKNKLET